MLSSPSLTFILCVGVLGLCGRNFKMERKIITKPEKSRGPGMYRNMVYVHKCHGRLKAWLVVPICGERKTNFLFHREHPIIPFPES
jgi:hypothetical protein